MTWPCVLPASLRSAGGKIKIVPEDFCVEELPAYEPSGQGEHLYLWVEKRGKSTQDVVRALAKALEVSPDDIGVAGLKDRQGVTLQYLSVPAKAEPRVSAFSCEGVLIHRAQRHGNKLRTGHLKGNRFRLRVREVSSPALAADGLRWLGEHGMPNYFGEQRFGMAGDNAALGKTILLGGRLPQKPDKFRRRLYLSSYQSLLFNRALAERVTEGTWNRALEGDVLRKEDSGGMFVCQSPEVEQPRVEAWEVSPAGPLFGPKLPPTMGVVAQKEAALLAAENIQADVFERGRGETLGARRAYRVKPKDVDSGTEGSDFWLAFSLPKGAYATVLLDELFENADVSPC